ncbi:MAG TPA: hypothetical protein VG406_12755 [Isosphaeraceae bacterium]|jgi:hypothetical protein|nr:hypothetical protein [Isosphaeraceae bacterium]
MDGMMNGYRFAVALVVAALFAGQNTVQIHLHGASRTIGGYVVSIAFLAAVAEFATLGIGRRLRNSTTIDGRGVPTRAAWAVATVLLVVDLFAKKLSAYIAVPHRPPPLWPTVAVVAGWVAILAYARRARSKRVAIAIGLSWLAAGTGLLVMLASPFDRLTGDMLWNINRALNALEAGRFPYLDAPPPMPYLSGTFLAYAPPHRLRLDLRLTNLVLLAVTAAAASRFLAPSGSRDDELSTSQWAFAFFLLQPTWVAYEVNTQYAPTVLASLILGRAVSRAGPWGQALALGVAVGTNQMLAASAPILAASWARRSGGRKALALTIGSIAVFLAMIGPFLLWNPRQFVAVAFLARGPLPLEVLSGRFTLLPLSLGVVPHASLVLSGLAIAPAAWFAWRARSGAGVVAAMALGLGAALLVQPSSFSHYVMPVIALAAAAPVEVGAAGRRGPHRAPGRGRGIQPQMTPISQMKEKDQ